MRTPFANNFAQGDGGAAAQTTTSDRERAGGRILGEMYKNPLRPDVTPVALEEKVKEIVSSPTPQPTQPPSEAKEGSKIRQFVRGFRGKGNNYNYNPLMSNALGKSIVQWLGDIKERSDEA